VKVVILAGGFGSRISEETHLKPKPMIEIGSKPILWHILKIYSSQGFNEFIICCGYKGYVIKEYFANYFLHMSDVTFDMTKNKMEVHNKNAEPWKVTLVDTGELSMTGGRLKRIEQYLNNETFCFTYGDGVADIDLNSLIERHKQSKSLATVTAVQPPGRYGSLNIGKENKVLNFKEKPEGDGGWINGGFFVLEPKVLNYINNDKTVWEEEPLQKLSAEGQLNVYQHNGFWQPMDTLRDQRKLEELWNKNLAPWKLWI